MHMPSGMLDQPRFDLGVLVGGVVVAHQMHIQVCGDGVLDVAQECQVFLMPMAWLALRDKRAVEHIQGGKQRRGAMASVIMRHAFDISEPHRQQGLCPLQGFLPRGAHDKRIRQSKETDNNGLSIRRTRGLCTF